jgi:MFS family permease
VAAQPPSLLATRRGKLLLLLLCAVQFLDVTDSSIMNVALPSIRRGLGFSAQDLQWVLSGYLVTYGGLLLLGGRAGARLGQGADAALMATAGLSILTTSFNSGDERNRALGVWARSPAWPRRPGCCSAACCPRDRDGGGCCSSTCRSAR